MQHVHLERPLAKRGEAGAPTRDEFEHGEREHPGYAHRRELGEGSCRRAAGGEHAHRARALKGVVAIHHLEEPVERVGIDCAEEGYERRPGNRQPRRALLTQILQRRGLEVVAQGEIREEGERAAYGEQAVRQVDEAARHGHGDARQNPDRGGKTGEKGRGEIPPGHADEIPGRRCEQQQALGVLQERSIDRQQECLVDKAQDGKGDDAVPVQVAVAIRAFCEEAGEEDEKRHMEQVDDIEESA